MESLRIAFVYDAVYPWIKGGVEKRIYEIGKRLADKGHEVHWYGVSWWSSRNSKKTIEKEGITLHGVCKPVQLYANDRRSIKEAIYFAAKLFPELVRERFDIIDCQEFPYFSCFSAKFCTDIRKSNLVITWHEVWGKYWLNYLGRKGIFGCLIEKLTAKLTKDNVAVSELTRRNLKKLGVNCVEIIPNGIDFKKIQKIKSGEESDIIFAGRLIKDKNVDILIKVVKLLKDEIPDIKCTIIGDGPERRRLEKLAKELRLKHNVEFRGFLKEYDDVIALMKGSKVFVLPSTREGFGIVALEANACGLPVVTVEYEMNATKDLVENDRNGFVCSLSEEEFVNKILVALYGDMSKRCLEFAKKYDWNVITKKCEKFYNLKINQTNKSFFARLPKYISIVL